MAFSRGSAEGRWRERRQGGAGAASARISVATGWVECGMDHSVGVARTSHDKDMVMSAVVACAIALLVLVLVLPLVPPPSFICAACCFAWRMAATAHCGCCCWWCG